LLVWWWFGVGIGIRVVGCVVVMLGWLVGGVGGRVNG
jgi:hypothetical protein